MPAEQSRGTSTGSASAPSPRPGGALPPQVTMGLLDYVTATSLDEDYAHVSRQQTGDAAERRTGRAGVAAMVALGLFGVLVATAAVQTSRNAGADERGREELVSQIRARSAQLDARRAQVDDLRTEIDGLQSDYLSATSQGRSLSDRMNRLGVLTGASAVTGPGVRVVVDDAPNATSAKQQVLDKDLQKLVNGLWESGAEAIAINGHRLTNLSAIRHAGSAITVNYVSLKRPYEVEAIGDPDSMPARFVETEHGAEWLDLQSLYGLQLEMTSEESLRLPAATRVALRNATTRRTP